MGRIPGDPKDSSSESIRNHQSKSLLLIRKNNKNEWKAKASIREGAQAHPTAPRSTKEHPGAPRSAQDPKSIEKQTIFSPEAQKLLKNKRFLAWRPKKY